MLFCLKPRTLGGARKTSENVETQHIKSPWDYLRMLCHGERGPLAEAARLGNCESSVSLRGSAALIEVQLRQKIVGTDCDHNKQTDDEQNHQPERAPEQTQWDFIESQPGTATCTSFLGTGKEKEGHVWGDTNPGRGVNLNWLNFNPDLTSDWVNLKWHYQVFSTADWWLLSKLDSFMGSHLYLYMRHCVHMTHNTKVHTKCHEVIERRQCIKLGGRVFLTGLLTEFCVP